MSGFSVVNTSTLTSVSALYQVKTAFGGNNVGDILQSVEIYNQEINPATPIDTVWNNLTQQVALGAITPVATNIIPIDSVTNLEVDTSALYFAVVGRAGQYSINDVIQQVVILDPYTVPPNVVSTEYNNLTTNTRNVTITASNDIVPVGTPGTGTNSYSTVVTLYTAIAAQAGQFAIGNVLQNVQTFNPATVPPTVLDSVWNNLSLQTVLTVVPSSVQITPGTSSSSAGGNTTFTLPYYAVNGGTGYSVGDSLDQIIAVDPASASPITIVSSSWYNSTTQLELAAAPLPGDVLPGLLTVSAQNYSTIVEQYVAVANAADYNIGDVLDAVAVLDMNTPSPVTLVSTSWFNLTQLTEFATTPPSSDIVPIGTQASYSTVQTLFAAKATVAGQYTITDTIRQIDTVDNSTVPSTILSTVWVNETTGTTIAAPLLTNLTAQQSQLPPALGPQTNANSLSVYVANQSTLSYFPVVTQYLVTTAFAVPAPGGSIGDTIQELQVYDATTSPATVVSSLWTNLTTGATYPSAPPIADLSPTSGTGLTNAELRAAPIQVINPPASRVSAMISVGASASGSTALGIVSASFYNNSTTVSATVAGGTLPPSTAIQFQANGTDTLAAIAYSTAAGGSLLIATLT